MIVGPFLPVLFDLSRADCDAFAVLIKLVSQGRLLLKGNVPEGSNVNEDASHDGWTGIQDGMTSGSRSATLTLAIGIASGDTVSFGPYICRVR